MINRKKRAAEISVTPTRQKRSMTGNCTGSDDPEAKCNSIIGLLLRIFYYKLYHITVHRSICNIFGANISNDVNEDIDRIVNKHIILGYSCKISEILYYII